MRELRFVLVLGSVLTFMLSGAAGAAETNKKDPAADQVEKPATLPAWIVTCTNMNVEALLRCKMHQTLSVAKTGQHIITVSFARDAEHKDSLDTVVQLPHGVKLDAGLTFWIDEGKKRLVNISYADAQGSYATFPVGKEIVDSLRTGKVLRLLVQAVSGDKTILELQLDGFGNSLKYL